MSFWHRFSIPTKLFGLSSLILLVLAMPLWNSDWMPSIPNPHFGMAQIGREFFAAAIIFAVCALLYGVLPVIFRVPMNSLLGKIHWTISIATVPLDFILIYYFNLTDRTPPDAPLMERIFDGLGSGIAADLWCLGVLAFAQLFFIANITVTIYKSRRSRAQAIAI
jgi:hypothetical protein